MKRLTFIKGLAMSGIGITLKNYLPWPNLTQRDLGVFPFPTPSSHVRHGAFSSVSSQRKTGHFAQVVARDLLLSNGYSQGQNDLEVIHLLVNGRQLSLSILGSSFSLTDSHQKLCSGDINDLSRGVEMHAGAKFYFLDQTHSLEVPKNERFMLAVLDGNFEVGNLTVNNSHACYGTGGGRNLRLQGAGRAVCIAQRRDVV